MVCLDSLMKVEIHFQKTLTPKWANLQNTGIKTLLVGKTQVVLCIIFRLAQPILPVLPLSLLPIPSSLLSFLRCILCSLPPFHDPLVFRDISYTPKFQFLPCDSTLRPADATLLLLVCRYYVQYCGRGCQLCIVHDKINLPVLNLTLYEVTFLENEYLII